MPCALWRCRHRALLRGLDALVEEAHHQHDGQPHLVRARVVGLGLGLGLWLGLGLGLGLGLTNPNPNHGGRHTASRAMTRPDHRLGCSLEPGGHLASGLRPRSALQRVALALPSPQ